MPTQHKQNRVYHWKHGWIPLDHQAAVQKYGSASLAQKHGFGHVAAKDLPRKEHITAHFDSNTGHFTLRDTRSGNTAKMTTRQADAHQRSGQQVTTIGQGGRISKTRAPAPVPTPAPPTPAPVRKSLPTDAQKRMASRRQAVSRIAGEAADARVKSAVNMLQKRKGKPGWTQSDSVDLEVWQAEHDRRFKGTGPAKDPAWVMRGMKRAPGTHQDAFRNANPAYNRNKKETYINCAKAVQAYELRRRGLDVQAQTHAANTSTENLASLWVNKDTGRPVPLQRVRSKADLERVMSRAPAGARFHVSVAWKGTPPGSPATAAHIFNAEKMIDGTISYYDAQVRQPSVRSYFSRTHPDHDIKVYRVDDAVPSDDPRWLKKFVQKN